MKNKEKDLTEIEQTIQRTVENVGIQPFNEMMKEIEPDLKKKRKQWKSPFMKIAAAVFSFILLVGISLTFYFIYAKNDTSHRYSGDDFACVKITKDDAEQMFGIFNFNLLSYDSYQKFLLEETQEIFFYRIDGFDQDDAIMRRVQMMIIVQPWYTINYESKYTDGHELKVKDITLSITYDGYDTNHLYNYKIGFVIDNIRYYIDYQTTSEVNDTEIFLNRFIK